MKRRRFISALTLATGAATLRLTALARQSASPAQLHHAPGVHASDTTGVATTSRPTDGAQLTSTERRVGDVSILDLKGQLTGSSGSLALNRAIARLRRSGQRKVLLNFAEVTNIDSRGIGTLVSSFTTLNRVKGQLKLVNLTTKIKDLLTVTKLLTVFGVYDNEAAALNSFKDAPAPHQQKSGEQSARETRAATSDSEIENKVKQIIVDELGVDEKEVKPEARFVEDLGADSLDVVELVMRFEEEFGIEIPDEDAEKMKRVRDVNAYLARHTRRPVKKP